MSDAAAAMQAAMDEIDSLRTALAAETERCAQFVEQFRPEYPTTYSGLSLHIAAELRASASAPEGST